MKKISIGIFAVVTVILFFLSISVSVTATIHTQEIMELGSYVSSSTPRASVRFTPKDVWSYAGWNWTVDVANGDDIVIKTLCTYGNSQGSPPAETGYHYYVVIADYSDPPTYDNDDADYEKYTGPDEGGGQTIEVSFTNVQEGARIDLTWYVEATNKNSNTFVWGQQTGIITLT